MIMKITNNFTHGLRNSNNENYKTLVEINNSPAKVSFAPIKYSQISFGAIYNVKSKNVDIDSEKNKLLKQTEEILKSQNQDSDLSDIISSAFNSALSRIRAKLKKQKEILDEIEALSENKTMSPQQKMNKANELKKSFKLLMKNKPAPKQSNTPKIQDEKLDFQLVNKFKSSINADNFNLDKVYKDYYKDLNNIPTVQELNEKYPKIKTPVNPKKVIAKKIENSLTRDFYEQLDDFFEEKNKEKIFELSDGKVRELSSKIAESEGLDAEEFYSKIAPYAHDAIIKRYVNVRLESGFSSLPEHRKDKGPIISKNDIDLLNVDFDKFVLYVVKKHYLDGQKLNDIKYNQDNITISAGSLKEPDYKFEKCPERIKKLMTSAVSITTLQRAYENFDPIKLKNRLNFHASREIGNNEQLLESIIAFDASNLENEDRESVIKFLRILDDIYDGKKTIKEGLSEIQTNDLRPKEIEKLNEIEKQKAAELYKAEQKKNFELNTLKNRFDDAINLLYMNNMNNIANTCSKYSPKNLEESGVQNAEFVMGMIENTFKDKNDTDINKGKLESNIIRWDTFNYYKNNEPQNPVYKNAMNFAKEPDGKTNIDNAGKYIINTEIVQNYPDSLEFVKNPSVLTKIMEKTEGNTEAAVDYLCKFDEYQDLSASEKTFISKILNIFDLKDSVDKVILRHIVENEYVKNDTIVSTNLYDSGSESVTSSISSSAKQQILSKYKYPLCLEFMQDFEEALTSFAASRGSSGIKKTGRNNKAIEYKMELKITGHNDRLFSSKNDFCFDIFSEKGIH